MDKQALRKRIIKWGIPLVCVSVLGSIYFATTKESLKPEATITTTKKTKDSDNIPNGRKQVENFIKDVEKPKEKSILSQLDSGNKTAGVSNLLEQAKSPNYQELDREKLNQELVAFNKNVMNQPKQEDNKPPKIDSELPKNPDESVKPPIIDEPEPPVVTPPIIEEPEPPIVTPPVESVDYSNLENALIQAKELDLSLYLVSSTETIKYEMLVGERLLTDKNATQLQVDNQVSRLYKSINLLEKKGDKTELKKLVSTALSIDREIYTLLSLNRLDEAVGLAESLLEQTEVSQLQVDQVVSTVQEALDGLTKIDEPNLSLIYLQRLVTESESIDLSLYTEESIQFFNEALTAAKSLLNQEEVTEEQVQLALVSLEQAKNNLEELPIIEEPDVPEESGNEYQEGESETTESENSINEVLVDEAVTKTVELVPEKVENVTDLAESVTEAANTLVNE